MTRDPYETKIERLMFRMWQAGDKGPHSEAAASAAALVGILSAISGKTADDSREFARRLADFLMETCNDTLSAIEDIRPDTVTTEFSDAQQAWSALSYTTLLSQYGPPENWLDETVAEEEDEEEPILH